MNWLIIYDTQDDRGNRCFYPVCERQVAEGLHFNTDVEARQYISDNAEALGENEYWVIPASSHAIVKKEVVTEFKVYT